MLTVVRNHDDSTSARLAATVPRKLTTAPAAVGTGVTAGCERSSSATTTATVCCVPLYAIATSRAKKCGPTVRAGTTVTTTKATAATRVVIARRPIVGTTTAAAALIRITDSACAAVSM